MSKRTNRELLPVRIIIAVAIVAIFAASLWLYFGQETVAMQEAKEAYAEYIRENPDSEERDFIYIWSDSIMVAIRNGKVVRKEYATEADAVKAALSSTDGASYSLSGTGNGKLFVVKLFEKTDDIYALGTSTLAAGADKLSIKVVSNGMIFATFEIPAEAIDRKESPVGITVKKINPEDNIKLGKNETGFAYDIDVTNLVENNTALINITMNGPRGLVADANKSAITMYHKDKIISSTYDATTGQISFSTTSFSPYTFTWDEIEISTLAQLRYYLQLPGRANLKLTADLTIDLATDREVGADGTLKYTNETYGEMCAAKGYYGGQWIYFGALVYGEKSLDLNGKTISYTCELDKNDNALFAVGDKASFTVRDNSSDESGSVKMLVDHYAIWAINDSSTINIYGGIFASDKYTGADREDGGNNKSLVYSSGGEVHVRGGYFLFENTDKDLTNGGFNVLNEITTPRVWIYGGVYLSEELYRENTGHDNDTIDLIGGANVSKVDGSLTIVGDYSVTQWYTITGQALKVKDNLNEDKYIYRVGNGNAFALSSFFALTDGTASCPDGLSVRAVNIIETREKIEAAITDKGYGNGGYYSQIGASIVNIDLGDVSGLGTTVQFTNTFTGPVRLELVDSDGTLYASINLEVVEGKNMTTSALSPNSTNKNVCLLNDITLSSSGAISISSGYAFYGNGFTITDGRTTTSQNTGLVSVSKGTLDNVQIIGYQTSVADASVTENSRAPIVSITGSANIYNSYIYGGRQPIFATATGTVYLKNVTLDGGSRANMEISGGDVILENCTTTTDTRNDNINGMGILVTTTGAKLTLNGTFTQHNWLKSSDLPSTYQSVLSSVYSDSSFAYNSTINMGIFFMSETVDFTEAQVKTQLIDNTGNTCGYVTKTSGGYTATCYLPKATMGAATFTAPEYQTLGNHPIVPKSTFDYTNKNYDAKETDDNVYCFYNSIGYVDISFETGGSKIWDTNILTATKFGKNLSVSVSMNGTDYTGKSITFTEAGDYELTYTCVDPYNYTADGVSYNLYYTQKLNIKVTVVEPEAVVYHPSFTYTDGSGTKQVIANNKTYVMPDVTGTSSTIGSTTVGDQTIYYPIVTVGGSSSSGGSYSRGKIYCFSPAFTAINITDYNKDTGETLYTYNKSTQTWPHNVSATTKVATDGSGAYYGYVSSEPYTGGTGDGYEVCKYNSTYGLSFVSSDIERNVTAATRLVQFYYVGNDGITYYYYIQYSQTAVTYKSCVTADTLVTLADGTQKRIDQVTYADKLLAWDFDKGEYTVVNSSIIENHGFDENDVIELTFDDGTKIKVVNAHGLFDADLNKWVDIDAENAKDFIGHHFTQMTGDSYKTVKLVDVDVRVEYVEAWAILTADQYNCILNGMFTVSPPATEQLAFFDIGADMKYDAEAKAADIEKYGLYTYEEFAHLMTYEQFEAFNIAEIKIAVGKGLITYEEVLGLLATYA